MFKTLDLVKLLVVGFQQPGIRIKIVFRLMVESDAIKSFEFHL